MRTPKQIQYLILVTLIFALPAYPKNLFSYCADAFQFAKQSVVDVANGEASTKKTIGVGLAALAIVYALIKCVLSKYHSVYKKYDVIDKNITTEQNQICKNKIDYKALRQKEIEKRIKENANSLKRLLKGSGIFLDDALIHAIENIKNDYAAEHAYLLSMINILQCIESKESNLISIIWSRPEILDCLINHSIKTRNLPQWQITDGLWAAAWKDSAVDKRGGIGVLIKYGGDINRKIPGIPNPHPRPSYYERTRTPLTDAILKGTPSIVKIFLEYGADIEINPGTSAYDYVEDVGKYGGYHKSKEQVYAILDNHRREIADKYRKRARAAVYTHLPQDPTGIVMEYVEPVYPLMDKRPLTRFELVDDGIKEARAIAA